jgi:hypothetical protein
MPQAEWFEYAALDVVRIARPGDGLDDCAEHLIVRVRVLEAVPGGGVELETSELAQRVREGSSSASARRPLHVLSPLVCVSNWRRVMRAAAPRPATSNHGK